MKKRKSSLERVLHVGVAGDGDDLGGLGEVLRLQIRGLDIRHDLNLTINQRIDVKGREIKRQTKMKANDSRSSKNTCR